MTWGANEWVAAVGLLVGAVIDARTGKIPNVVTASMMVAGIGWWSVQGAPGVALLGLAGAFALHYLLFVLHVEKAGDAKLFMGFAALTGAWEMLEATGITCFVYVPVALGVLIAKGRLSRLKATAHYVAARAQGVEAEKMPAPEQTMLRTGPIIAVAGWLAMLMGA